MALYLVLTSTSRSLISPTPCSIGQALDVGGANTIIPRVAGKDYFSSILIMRTIDYSPSPMIQREGTKAGAGHYWKGKNK